jgi:hypothetical protein
MSWRIPYGNRSCRTARWVYIAAGYGAFLWFVGVFTSRYSRFGTCDVVRVPGAGSCWFGVSCLVTVCNCKKKKSSYLACIVCGWCEGRMLYLPRPLCLSYCRLCIFVSECSLLYSLSFLLPCQQGVASV